ncbi:uncharacterized protein LOC106144715 isoform X2 [Ictidomys tridecemlineatus]
MLRLRRRRRARPSPRCRLLPAARRLSGLSRRRARGAGGTRRPPPPPPRRPPPSSRLPPPGPAAGSARRARGSRGAMLTALPSRRPGARGREGAAAGESAGGPRARSARALTASPRRAAGLRGPGGRGGAGPSGAGPAGGAGPGGRPGKLASLRGRRSHGAAEPAATRRCGAQARPPAAPLPLPLRVYCVWRSLRRPGRARGPGLGRPRAGGSSGGRWTCARPARLASASRPRPGPVHARSYLPSSCLRRLYPKLVSAYSHVSTHELHINTHVKATYVQARSSPERCAPSAQTRGQHCSAGPLPASAACEWHGPAPRSAGADCKGWRSTNSRVGRTDRTTS